MVLSPISNSSYCDLLQYYWSSEHFWRHQLSVNTVLWGPKVWPDTAVKILPFHRATLTPARKLKTFFIPQYYLLRDVAQLLLLTGQHNHTPREWRLWWAPAQEEAEGVTAEPHAAVAWQTLVHNWEMQLGHTPLLWLLSKLDSRWQIAIP